ncbi:type II secretion system F family protein [Azohydromonas caseinilytica]|uniref:Type II secretion system F family protein n=1 Tax=Azohydromonas caseinilytica TaxID=2728836 RepID=A0A848F7Z5_9BURK|nr:type II secretion system F family protein [Azohydromonas caseinilytica]NML15308.1 type II secretion system F family protein [Azohydromonas caseinilytica]
MSAAELGFVVLVFVASAALVLLVGQLTGGNATKERARRLAAGDTQPRKQRPWIEMLARGTRPLARFSESETGAQLSALRRRLMHAGLRHPQAPTAYYGTKTLLALVLPLLAFSAQLLLSTPLEGSALLLVLLSTAALGYYFPNVVLARLVFLRQREIFESFPDALDLITVCVEAGLGIEAALARVSEEMQYRSQVLSTELQLVGLELRAGAPREHALHNLAMRTGVDEVDSFVSMLVQAERFGTSIAQALRVHADMLRTRRRQRAEEAAAKIAIKLLLPLIFCIFPALLLVLLGPAMINIYRVLMPTLSAG